MSAEYGRMARRGVLMAVAVLAVAGRAAGQAPPPLFDGDGYRASAYRAPVDRDPSPAGRIALAAALGLGGGALFVDVLPAPGAARDAQGRWQLAEPHQTIPGALWVPEAGRANPDPARWQALRAAVAHWRARHGGGPVVVFCRADCWMSWNAARRLAREGVGDVWWLAEGIEGWHEAGRALVPALPDYP